LTTGSRPPPRYRAGPLRWCWPWSASSCRGAVTSPDGPDGANAMLGSRTVLHAEMDPGGVANAGAGPADFDMGHATCPAGRGGGDEEEESCGASGGAAGSAGLCAQGETSATRSRGTARHRVAATRGDGARRACLALRVAERRILVPAAHRDRLLAAPHGTPAVGHRHCEPA